MQAQCPQCKATFQTERTGAQFCPNCGQQVNVADVSGAAAPGAALAAAPQAGPPPRQPTPWERRKELGFVQGLWQTWKGLITQPDRFWYSVKPDAPISDALFYGWLIAVVEAIISAPFIPLMAGQMRDSLAQLHQAKVDVPPEMLRFFESFIAGPGAYGRLLGAMVFYPLGLVILAGIVHLFGLIFGAAKNGFGATMRVLAYASGPMVLGGIPYVGGLVGIYVIVLQIWGLMRVQETTGWRAAGAVLGIWVLALCCSCVGLIAVVASVAGGVHG